MVEIDNSKLVCYGCCHSAGNEDYPSMPSGERPCNFCIRNPKRTCEVKVWYDGSKALKIPMDCYHSLDMLDQFDKWEEENKKENKKLKKENEILRGQISLVGDILDSQRKAMKI